MKKAILLIATILLILALAGAVNAQNSGMILLANSIDYANAGTFTSFLEGENVDITHVTASDFTDTEKETQFIVILGGPDAPEGIGEIVREVLSLSEETYLRQSGSRSFYTKTDVWGTNQTVMVLAGSNRDGTKLSMGENKNTVSKKVKDEGEAEEEIEEPEVELKGWCNPSIFNREVTPFVSAELSIESANNYRKTGLQIDTVYKDTLMLAKLKLNLPDATHSVPPIEDLNYQLRLKGAENEVESDIYTLIDTDDRYTHKKVIKLEEFEAFEAGTLSLEAKVNYKFRNYEYTICQETEINVLDEEAPTTIELDKLYPIDAAGPPEKYYFKANFFPTSSIKNFNPFKVRPVNAFVLLNTTTTKHSADVQNIECTSDQSECKAEFHMVLTEDSEYAEGMCAKNTDKYLVLETHKDNEYTNKHMDLNEDWKYLWHLC